MGVDYNGEPNNGQRRFKTGMMLMKVIPAVSYRTGNTTFGFAPVLGLGSMSMNWDDSQTDSSGYRDPSQSSRKGLFGTNIGGDSLNPAFGWQAGMDIKVTEKLRIGTTYNSALKYKYKDVGNFKQFGPHGMVNMMNDFSNGALNGGDTVDQAIEGLFGPGATTDYLTRILEPILDGTVAESLEATSPNNLDDLTMEQPWEVAIGFGYDLTDQVTITGDYRYIAWGLAEGYDDFGWENQSVYAMGFEFRPSKKFRFRGGYNYADSPLRGESGEIGTLLNDVQGSYVFNQSISMLNMVGFPAITTTHFTLGAGYDFTKNLTIDGAFMYSPEREVTRSGALIPGASALLTSASGLPDFTIDAADMTYSYTTKMEQMTLSLGINYRF